MSLRAAIRDLMLAHGAPMRPVEVSVAMPEVDAEKITYSIMGMYNEGILSRVKREDGYSGYYASRNVKLVAYATEEERLAAKRAADLRRNETLRNRRRAERAAIGALAAYRERQAAARIAREAQRTEAKRQKAQDRARRATERALERAARPKPAPKPRKPPKSLPRPETVEEWMARTGRQPERIPAGWEREQIAA